jgi:hypothetical protein
MIGVRGGYRTTQWNVLSEQSTPQPKDPHLLGCAVLSGECSLTFVRMPQPSLWPSRSPREGNLLSPPQQHIPKGPHVHQHCCKSLKLRINYSLPCFVFIKELLPMNNICQFLARTIPTNQYTPVSVNLLSNSRSLYKGFKVHIYSFFLNHVTTYINFFMIIT